MEKRIYFDTIGIEFSRKEALFYLRRKITSYMRRKNMLKRGKYNILFIDLKTNTSKLAYEVIHDIVSKWGISNLSKLEFRWFEDAIEANVENYDKVFLPLSIEHYFVILLSYFTGKTYLKEVNEKFLIPTLDTSEREISIVFEREPVYDIFRDELLKDIMDLLLKAIERNPKYARTPKKTFHLIKWLEH